MIKKPSITIYWRRAVLKPCSRLNETIVPNNQILISNKGRLVCSIRHDYLGQASFLRHSEKQHFKIIKNILWGFSTVCTNYKTVIRLSPEITNWSRLRLSSSVKKALSRFSGILGFRISETRYRDFFVRYVLLGVWDVSKHIQSVPFAL